MVPKKSRFCPKGPNFAIVASFRAKSQIPNPVSERMKKAKKRKMERQAEKEAKLSKLDFLWEEMLV